MKQEEKELLLKDLCARLSYGVKCNVWYGPKSPALNEKDKYTDDILETINPKKGNCTFHNAIGYDFGFFPVEHVKPYLRPMSSMTEEERDRLRSLDGFIRCDMLYNIVEGDFEVFDYLNSIHVSYRTFNGKDMFELGLALEAPKDMYNLKEK